MNDSAARKASPVWSGCMNYFRRALTAISRVSKAGNEKWNPGMPLHWSKEKSPDHPDCVARHNLTPYAIDPESGERHFVHAAWRQLAWVEICHEAVELGICTWDQLENGDVAAEELGPYIVQHRALAKIIHPPEEEGGHLVCPEPKCSLPLDHTGDCVPVNYFRTRTT